MLPPTRKPRLFDMTSEPGVIDDSDLAPVASVGSLPDLSRFEVKVLRRALKRLRHEAQRDDQRNAERGWQPEPGKQDVIKMTLEAVDSLLGRLPFPALPEDRS